MNKSENIGNLAKALANVQKQIKPAVKDSANPFFKSKYADLNSVWDSCRDLLASNGLSVVQINDESENGVIVETVLMHESNEWISGRISLPLSKHDAQGVGSAITYGRRYGLAAIIGIVADDDDDGNAASKQPQSKSFDDIDRQSKARATAANGQPMIDRIIKAEQEIRKLDGKPLKRIGSESDENFLQRLTDQYKGLKG